MISDNPSVSDKDGSIKISEIDYDQDSQSQASNSISSFDIDTFNDNTSNEGTNYPKICSMCYLGDNSMLGQGHLIRFEPSKDFDVFSLELSQIQDTMHLYKKHLLEKNIPNDNIYSNKPSKFVYSIRRNRGSKNNLKYKKKNSHYLQEPLGMDELKATGFPPCSEVTAFFEKTGHTWVHEYCAFWSYGVTANTDLYPNDKVALINVDKIVIKGLTQECYLCKNYGATLQCLVANCNVKYHMPCATCSGCILNISEKAILCFNHLNMGKELGYKFECKLCLKEENLENMLSCITCGIHYHSSCLVPQGSSYALPPAHLKAGWQCHECKICQICKSKDDNSKFVMCDNCDKAFHIFCLKPSLLTIPKNGWKCKNCRICIDCGSRTPGSGPSSRWHLNFTICDSCYQQRNKGLCCPLCNRAYRQHFAHKDKMAKCKACHKYIHIECDPSALKTEIYRCTICIKNQQPIIASPLQSISLGDNAYKEGNKNTNVENIFEIGSQAVNPSPSFPNSGSESKRGLMQSPVRQSNSSQGSVMGSPPSVKLTLKHVDNKYMVVIHDSPDSSSNETSPGKITPKQSVNKSSNAQVPLSIKNTSPCPDKNIKKGGETDENPNQIYDPISPDKLGDSVDKENPYIPAQSESTKLFNADINALSNTPIIPSQPNETNNDEDMENSITLDPPAVDDDDDDPSNVPVLFSLSDKFTYYRDICVSCGSFGIEQEATLIFCYQCGQSYHPFCVSIKLTKTIALNGWRCYKCLICEGCGKSNDESRLLLCDDCDISYHTYCLDPPLSKIPQGSWKCDRCAICHTCSSRNSGKNCEWQNNFTQCGPCASHDICPLCRKRYQDCDIILECSACLRWVHGHCENVKDEWEAGHVVEKGFRCRLCIVPDLLINTSSNDILLTAQSNNVATLKRALQNKRGFSKERPQSRDLNVPLTMTEGIYNFDTPIACDKKVSTSTEVPGTNLSYPGDVYTNTTSDIINTSFVSSAAPNYRVPSHTSGSNSITSYIADIVRSVIGSAHGSPIAQSILPKTPSNHNISIDNSSISKQIYSSLALYCGTNVVSPSTLYSAPNLLLYPSRKNNMDGITLTEKGLRFLENLIDKRLSHQPKFSFALGSSILAIFPTSLEETKKEMFKISGSTGEENFFPPKSHTFYQSRTDLAIQASSGSLCLPSVYSYDRNSISSYGGQVLSHNEDNLNKKEFLAGLDPENLYKQPPSHYQRRSSNKIGSGIGGFFVKPRKPLGQGISTTLGIGVNDGPTSCQGDGISVGSLDLNENSMPRTEEIIIGTHTSGGGPQMSLVGNVVESGSTNGDNETLFASSLLINNPNANHIVKRKRITKKRGHIAETYPYYLQDLFFGDIILKRGSTSKPINASSANGPATKGVPGSHLSIMDDEIREFLDDRSQNDTLERNMYTLSVAGLTSPLIYQVDPSVDAFQMSNILRRFMEPLIPFSYVVDKGKDAPKPMPAHNLTHVMPAIDQSQEHYQLGSKFLKNRVHKQGPGRYLSRPPMCYQTITSLVLNKQSAPPPHYSFVTPHISTFTKENVNCLKRVRDNVSGMPRNFFTTISSLLLNQNIDGTLKKDVLRREILAFRGALNVPNFSQPHRNQESKLVYQNQSSFNDRNVLTPATSTHDFTNSQIFNQIQNPYPTIIGNPYVGSLDSEPPSLYDTNRTGLESYLPIVTTLPQMNSNDIEALLGSESDIQENDVGFTRIVLKDSDRNQVVCCSISLTSSISYSQTLQHSNIPHDYLSPKVAYSTVSDLPSTPDDACIMSHSPFNADHLNYTTTSTQRNLLRWQKDEALGVLATISPVLYANIRYPQLKTEYPDMLERSKHIAKIWRNITPDERIPFLQKARENRAILRVQKSQQKSLEHQILTSLASVSSSQCCEENLDIKTFVPGNTYTSSIDHEENKQTIKVSNIKEEFLGIQPLHDQNNLLVSITTSHDSSLLPITTSSLITSVAPPIEEKICDVTRSLSEKNEQNNVATLANDNLTQTHTWSLNVTTLGTTVAISMMHRKSTDHNVYSESLTKNYNFSNTVAYQSMLISNPKATCLEPLYSSVLQENTKLPPFICNKQTLPMNSSDNLELSYKTTLTDELTLANNNNRDIESESIHRTQTSSSFYDNKLKCENLISSSCTLNDTLSSITTLPDEIKKSPPSVSCIETTTFLLNPPVYLNPIVKEDDSGINMVLKVVDNIDKVKREDLEINLGEPSISSFNDSIGFESSITTSISSYIAHRGSYYSIEPLKDISPKSLVTSSIRASILDDVASLTDAPLSAGINAGPTDTLNMCRDLPKIYGRISQSDTLMTSLVLVKCVASPLPSDHSTKDNTIARNELLPILFSARITTSTMSPLVNVNSVITSISAANTISEILIGKTRNTNIPSSHKPAISPLLHYPTTLDYSTYSDFLQKAQVATVFADTSQHVALSKDCSEHLLETSSIPNSVKSPSSSLDKPFYTASPKVITPTMSNPQFVPNYVNVASHESPHQKLSRKSSQLLDDILSDLSSIEETKFIFKDISSQEMLGNFRPLAEPTTASYAPEKAHLSHTLSYTTLESSSVNGVTRSLSRQLSSPLFRVKTGLPNLNANLSGIPISSIMISTVNAISHHQYMAQIHCSNVSLTGSKYRRELKRDHQRMFSEGGDHSDYYPSAKKFANLEEENIMSQIDFDKLNEVFGGNSTITKPKPIGVNYYPTNSHNLSSPSHHIAVTQPSNLINMTSVSTLLAGVNDSNAALSYNAPYNDTNLNFTPRPTQPLISHQFRVDHLNKSDLTHNNPPYGHQFVYNDLKKTSQNIPRSHASAYSEYLHQDFYPTCLALQNSYITELERKKISLNMALRSEPSGANQSPLVVESSSCSFEGNISSYFNSSGDNFEVLDKGNLNRTWSRNNNIDSYTNLPRIGNINGNSLASPNLYTTTIMSLPSPNKHILKASNNHNNTYTIGPNDYNLFTKGFPPNNHSQQKLPYPFVCDKTLSINLCDPNLSEIQTDDPSIYQNWLLRRDALLQENLTKLAADIAKLRKRKKSLASKQRQLRKTGDGTATLPENEAHELAQLNVNIAAMQKHIEALRKELKQHKTLISDFQMKEDGREKSALSANYQSIPRTFDNVISPNPMVSSLLPSTTPLHHVASKSLKTSTYAFCTSFPSPHPILSPNIQYSPRNMYRLTSPSNVTYSPIQLSLHYSTGQACSKPYGYGSEMSLNPPYKTYPGQRFVSQNYPLGQGETYNQVTYNNRAQFSPRYQEASLSRFNLNYQRPVLITYNGTRNVNAYENVSQVNNIYHNICYPSTQVCGSEMNNKEGQFVNYDLYNTLQRVSYGDAQQRPCTPLSIKSSHTFFQHDHLSPKYRLINTSFSNESMLGSPHITSKAIHGYDGHYKTSHTSPHQFLPVPISKARFSPKIEGHSRYSIQNRVNEYGQMPEPGAHDIYLKGSNYRETYPHTKPYNFQLPLATSYINYNEESRLDSEIISPHKRNLISCYSGGMQSVPTINDLNIKSPFSPHTNLSHLSFNSPKQQNMTDISVNVVSSSSYRFPIPDGVKSKYTAQMYPTNTFLVGPPSEFNAPPHTMPYNREQQKQRNDQCLQNIQVQSYQQTPYRYPQQYHKYVDQMPPPHPTLMAQGMVKQTSNIRGPTPHAPSAYHHHHHHQQHRMLLATNCCESGNVAVQRVTTALPLSIIDLMPPPTTPPNSSSVMRFILSESRTFSNDLTNEAPSLPCSAYTIYGMGNVEKGLTLLDNKFGSLQLSILPNYYSEFPYGRFTLPASFLLPHSNIVKALNQKANLIQNILKLENVLPFAPLCLHLDRSQDKVKIKKGKSTNGEDALDKEIAAITLEREFLKNFDLSPQNLNTTKTPCFSSDELSPSEDQIISDHTGTKYPFNQPVESTAGLSLKKDKVVTTETMFASLTFQNDFDHSCYKEAIPDSPEIPLLVHFSHKDIFALSPTDNIAINEPKVAATNTPSAKYESAVFENLSNNLNYVTNSHNTLNDEHMTVTIVIDKTRQDALSSIMNRLGHLLGIKEHLNFSVEKNIDIKDEINNPLSSRIINNKIAMISERNSMNGTTKCTKVSSTLNILRSTDVALGLTKSTNLNHESLLKHQAKFNPLSFLHTSITYCYNCHKAIVTPQLRANKNDLDRLLTLIDGPFGTLSYRDFCSNNCLAQCIINRKRPQLFWSKGTVGQQTQSSVVYRSKGTTKVRTISCQSSHLSSQNNTTLITSSTRPTAGFGVLNNLDVIIKKEHSPKTLHKQFLLSSFRLWKGKKYKVWSTTSINNINSNVDKSEVKVAQDDPLILYKRAIDACQYISHLGRAYSDSRICLLCNVMGDGHPEKLSRLLNLDIDKWVHLNCALWSSEVYETVSGALMNVETAIKRGAGSFCTHCSKPGATCDCNNDACNNIYHFPCALIVQCKFYNDKTLLCALHHNDPEIDGSENVLTSYAVLRRVFIDRNLAQQIANVLQRLDSYTFRIGALIFNELGQLLPEQLQNFHNINFIYPIGYRTTRYYWDYRGINLRVPYSCMIQDVDNMPKFYVQVLGPHLKDSFQENDLNCKLIGGEVFEGSTPKEAWDSVFLAIANLRKKEIEFLSEDGAKMRYLPTKLFPRSIRGEDLFGLSEGPIIRVLESLPGVEHFMDYRFKFGRTQTIQLPLTINPSGCARTEPKLRTHFRKPIILSSAPCNYKNMPCSFDSFNFEYGLFYEPTYGKQYGLSKDAQYRKMKSEWKQNIYLGKSRIQGLGLFASRDFGKDVMIIEYIGEIIRCELAEVRERAYHAQNKSTTYLFRLDDDTVLDATICGGPARYINHSCDPNCRAELISIAPTNDFSTLPSESVTFLTGNVTNTEYFEGTVANKPPVIKINKIVIISNRKIQRGEELCYDYKFEYEGENNKLSCLCGAHNCKKWMN